MLTFSSPVTDLLSDGDVPWLWMSTFCPESPRSLGEAIYIEPSSIRVDGQDLAAACHCTFKWGGSREAGSCIFGLSRYIKRTPINPADSLNAFGDFAGYSLSRHLVVMLRLALLYSQESKNATR